ncbi:hypothetical protein LQF12_07185 [Ruania suaedae]|uniref:hypothetical protein n=1 Tax=Ruania suaedae TaxID=2897774 RepID=UPI001E4367D1|nr:hypothetical protein [Ruania suaedae]UFU04356.1 hypothetical protein LQF12_07185 [Ruania suaedae]
MMRAGAEYILFVTEFEPGHYRINGGPTGRLLVQEGGSITHLPGSLISPADLPETLTQAEAEIFDPA